MCTMIRTAALVAAFAAAGCLSNNEVAQMSFGSSEASPIYGEMHAAIPASAGNGHYFEYQ